MRIVDGDNIVERMCKYMCGCRREECGLTYERNGTENCTMVRFVEESPEVDKICGYPIKELVTFAQMCRSLGIENADVKQVIGNMRYTLELVNKTIDEQFQEIIERAIQCQNN